MPQHTKAYDVITDKIIDALDKGAVAQALEPTTWKQPSERIQQARISRHQSFRPRHVGVR